MQYLQDDVAVKCPKCGKEIEKEGHRYCMACTLKHDAIRHGEGGLHWEYRIPLIANSVLWRDIIFALGVPVLIIAVIVIIISNANDRLWVLVLFGVLFLIFLIVALVVMVALSRSLGGGLFATFSVNNAGISYEAGHLAKKLTRGTRILSLMSGSINAGGTTLIALSQEENFISWQDVQSVKIYSRQQVVHVRSKEPKNPIALYCTSDNFVKATEMISNKIPRTAIR